MSITTKSWILRMHSLQFPFRWPGGEDLWFLSTQLLQTSESWCIIALSNTEILLSHRCWTTDPTSVPVIVIRIARQSLTVSPNTKNQSMFTVYVKLARPWWCTLFSSTLSGMATFFTTCIGTWATIQTGISPLLVWNRGTLPGVTVPNNDFLA